jgi:hypothetical protein
METKMGAFRHTPVTVRCLFLRQWRKNLFGGGRRRKRERSGVKAKTEEP